MTLGITESCIECGASIKVTDDMTIGEIVSCPDCGKDYVIEKDELGSKVLLELNLEGQDFGE